MPLSRPTNVSALKLANPLWPARNTTERARVVKKMANALMPNRHYEAEMARLQHLHERTWAAFHHENARQDKSLRWVAGQENIFMYPSHNAFNSQLQADEREHAHLNREHHCQLQAGYTLCSASMLQAPALHAPKPTTRPRGAGDNNFAAYTSVCYVASLMA